MTQSPPRCLTCGRGNTPDVHDHVPPALDLERDVGWGDSTYLCKECCEKIGLLWGWMPPETVREMEDQLNDQAMQLHELHSEMEEKERRMNKILAGREALRQEREARKIRTRSARSTTSGAS